MSFDSARIHPFFNVSQLKLSLKCDVAVTALPLGMEVGDSDPAPQRPFSQTLKKLTQWSPIYRMFYFVESPTT